MKEISSNSGAGISILSVEPALTMSSETPTSSKENSVSFSRFRPPYLMAIASAGMYLRRVSVTLVGRAKTNLLLVLWVKKGEKRALNAYYQKGTLMKIFLARNSG